MLVAIVVVSGFGLIYGLIAYLAAVWLAIRLYLKLGWNKWIWISKFSSDECWTGYILPPLSIPGINSKLFQDGIGNVIPTFLVLSDAVIAIIQILYIGTRSHKRIVLASDCTGNPPDSAYSLEKIPVSMKCNVSSNLWSLGITIVAAICSRQALRNRWAKPLEWWYKGWC